MKVYSILMILMVALMALTNSMPAEEKKEVSDDRIGIIVRMLFELLIYKTSKVNY